jgi:hypothetical protein
MKRAIIWGFIAVLSMGCGGLSDDLKLSGLSDDEVEELCADSTTESEDCGGGVKATSNNSVECAAAVRALPDSCVATVSDFNECESEGLCERTGNAACGKIVGCLTP